MMKTVFALLLIANILNAAAQPLDFFKSADEFLQESIENGLVKYQYIKDNPAKLNALINQIETYLIVGKEPEVQKAFFTNAYNILVIKQIVNNYPLFGPLKLDGFFDKKTFIVAGQKMTLDQLEKEVLFAAFPDPRLHFVLVCAAVGCPPISDYAFTPDSMEVQLERKTTEVLNINWYIRVYKTNTQVSEVFRWYEKDFVNDTTDIKDYINKYRELKIPESHKLNHYEYDWSLNDISSSTRY